LGYDIVGNHSFEVPWGLWNALRRDHQTIGRIQDAPTETQSLRQTLKFCLRRIRWTAIFIYGASAVFGLTFWLLVLKFVAHIH
jgi:hypothetical protein